MKEKNSPVAIVTGATAGIGLATADLLKKEGYTVYGTGSRQESDSQNGIAMLACDVTRDESVASAIAEVLRRSGRIDLLVNNAGFGLIAGAEESSIEQAKSIFDVNVFGAMRMPSQTRESGCLRHGLAQALRGLLTGSRLAFTDLPVRLEIPLDESRLVIPSAWHHLTERLFIKAGSPE